MRDELDLEGLADDVGITIRHWREDFAIEGGEHIYFTYTDWDGLVFEIIQEIKTWGKRHHDE